MSSDGRLPNGLIVFGPKANCTIELCGVEASVYGYQPNLAANITYLVLFALTIPVQLILGVRYRSWFYTGSIILGSVSEILGYAGRIILYYNPFSFNGFLLQIICITFAAVFYTAAIYVTLSRIVQQLNPKLAWFSPKLYYWLFIPCDIVSLVVQASGGGLSSTSSGSSNAAVNVSIAGLAFQVLTLTIFVALAAEYGIRYARFTSKQEKPQRTLTRSFKAAVTLLSASTILIWIRCCYRIHELSGGYRGPNIRDEGLFIGLESTIVLIASWLLVAAGVFLARNPYGETSGKTPDEISDAEA